MSLTFSITDLECYHCYYHEVNGQPLPGSDNRDVCRYFPWNGNVVDCADRLGAPAHGHVYRCALSEWRTSKSNGDVGKRVYNYEISYMYELKCPPHQTLWTLSDTDL